MGNNFEMTPAEALKYVEEIRKLLISKKIWYNIQEVNDPELKFINIEASIKVKQ